MGRTPYLGGIRGPKGEDREMAWSAMEEIGITELSDRPYTQLSGGQRQLVLMARALAQDTPVLVLKEGEVMARGAVSDTLTQPCLEGLYGQICQLQNDVIIPKRNACA